MDEINKLLERIESDLISDGYVDGNVVLKDVKKMRKLAMNFTRCCTTLPTKQDMWEERGKQVTKIEESNTAFSKHTPHLLGFTLGFEKCYEWLTK